MKTQKFKIQIIVKDHKNGEIYSIIQKMSKQTLGTWIKYFVKEQGDKIEDIIFLD